MYSSIVSHRGTINDIVAIHNIRRVGRFAIAGSISSVKLNDFCSASVYGFLLHMQNALVPIAVDEEQDIRNDGSKSSRSHRAFNFHISFFLPHKCAPLRPNTCVC
jgi:hypothetical protein